MNIQDFVGEIVFSKTDGKGRIEKVIWGKNTYFKVVFWNGTQKVYRIPRAFLSGILTAENVELNEHIKMMPDIEFKANEDLMSVKELGISISKKCALTSKNLALLGALDDFYALYFKIFDELMQEMIEHTKFKMEKKGEVYDGRIDFYLNDEMKRRVRRHFNPVLNKNVNLFTNEYESFRANKGEFRNFQYFFAQGGQYRRATFQEFCQSIEWIYIDTIYKWKQQINPNIRLDNVENDVNTRLQILAAMREKEILNKKCFEEQGIDDETLYLVRALPMMRCYQEKHEIIAKRFCAKILNGGGVVILPTHYCTECKKFFIGDKTLAEYEKQFGKILVRTQRYLTQEKEASAFDGFNPESRLHQYGYNVKANELTELERQRILIALIKSGQITYYEICQTIEQCINLFQSQTKYAQAVKKWEKDLKFIGDYIKTVT